MQLMSKQAAETSSAESLRYFVPSVKTLGTMRDIPLERPVRLGSTLDVSLSTLHDGLQPSSGETGKIGRGFFLALAPGARTEIPTAASILGPSKKLNGQS